MQRKLSFQGWQPGTQSLQNLLPLGVHYPTLIDRIISFQPVFVSTVQSARHGGAFLFLLSGGTSEGPQCPDPPEDGFAVANGRGIKAPPTLRQLPVWARS